jgi:2-polyprenyl-3-methyl-5-hydroxy-6-metoxy-1,4-benzoquinol methylase
MPNFSRRSTEIEVMDDLNCSGQVLGQTLRELEIINRWLGGNAITLNGLERLLEKHTKTTNITIADLGCGGGEMLRIIAAWGKKRNLKLKLVGIDANPNVIAYAKTNLKDLPDIQLQTLNIFSEEFHRQPYDIVVGTLFFHHFSNEQLVSFFHRLKEHVTFGLIINDIHRHWLAYYSIKILTGLFSQSSMVKYDAPLSVMRAFKRHELTAILQTGSFSDFKIWWKWAFRWQVVAKFVR